MKNEGGANNNNFPGANAPRRPKDLIGAKIGENSQFECFFLLPSLREKQNYCNLITFKLAFKLQAD